MSDLPDRLDTLADWMRDFSTEASQAEWELVREASAEIRRLRAKSDRLAAELDMAYQRTQMACVNWAEIDRQRLAGRSEGEGSEIHAQ